METFRNNGIKFNPDRLTNEDILGLVGNTAGRADRVLGELMHVMDLGVQRGIIEVVDPGEQPVIPPEAA